MNPTHSPNEQKGVVQPALSVEIAQIVSLSTHGQIGLQTAVTGAGNNTRHIIATSAGPPAAVAAFLRQMAEEIEHPLYVVTTDGEHQPEVRGPFYDSSPHTDNRIGSSWVDRQDPRLGQHGSRGPRKAETANLPDTK